MGPLLLSSSLRARPQPETGRWLWKWHLPGTVQGTLVSLAQPWLPNPFRPRITNAWSLCLRPSSGSPCPWDSLPILAPHFLCLLLITPASAPPPRDHLPFPTTLHLHNLRPFIHCLLLLSLSHSRSTLRTEGPRARSGSHLGLHPLSPALLLGQLLVTAGATPEATAWNWVVKRGSPKPPRAVGPPVRSPTHHTGPAPSWGPRGAPRPLRGLFTSGPAH